ncbi:MAG: class III extradiol ring-cleavage dioxygenase [Bdellovibrionota bacterium]
MTTNKMPTFFISHGGGPWPYIPEMRAQFARTATWLENLPQTLPARPKAIVSISGHWETPEFAVSTAAQPPMIYDYSGFPPHTYSITYKAPGEPTIARHIKELLTSAKISALENPTHGFDHGTFVPLYLMYPNAEIPVISMSIKSNYSPNDHFEAGLALQALRDEGILIIGSGLSYHNMRGFGRPESKGVSELFGKWLKDTVEENDTVLRKQRLLDWEKAPAARNAHPREDHLIPLMLVAGAGGVDKGTTVFTDHVMGVDMASYRFG